MSIIHGTIQPLRTVLGNINRVPTGGGGSSSTPKITLDMSQVVSQDPLTLLMTQEQKDVIENTNNGVMYVDSGNLGMGGISFIRADINDDDTITFFGVDCHHADDWRIVNIYTVNYTKSDGYAVLSQLDVSSDDVLIDEALELLAQKIDEPSTEGTAGQVLTTDGNGGRSWTTISNPIPTVTISLSQIISQDPLVIQITQEQQQIIEDIRNTIIYLDSTSLGYGATACIRSDKSRSSGYIHFTMFHGSLASNEVFMNYIEYDMEEKTGTLLGVTVKDSYELQTKEITDEGGYFTADTVEGALQEIGATLDGLDAALAALL